MPGVPDSQVGAPGAFTGSINPNSDPMKNITEPLTGFARQYSPSGLNAQIWDNPWSILSDVFSGRFRTPTQMAGPGYQALRDIGADPLTLYNIGVGSGTDFLTGGGNAAGNYTNWLADLYKGLGTVGGRGFSAKELLDNLFNPMNKPNQEGGQSSLFNILTAGDAPTQMRTLFNMIRDSANVGMNPLAARGYTAAATRGGDAVLANLLHQNADQGGNTTPVYQLFKQLNPGLVPG